MPLTSPCHLVHGITSRRYSGVFGQHAKAGYGGIFGQHAKAGYLAALKGMDFRTKAAVEVKFALVVGNVDDIRQFAYKQQFQVLTTAPRSRLFPENVARVSREVCDWLPLRGYTFSPHSIGGIVKRSRERSRERRPRQPRGV
eukprot:1178972-Prorocentrum_minimum.AAC.4